jgi:glyoxylase-like metal-dependent hydrolase (beta-lactamase superfamily II)
LREIAPGLYLLDGTPKYGFNVYLMGDVIIDSATRRAARRILRQVRDRPVLSHAITHAHADHQGSSHRICEALQIPLLCPAGEADGMESGAFSAFVPDGRITRWQLRHWAGPAHPVDRRLREGDDVGGFTVIETPGHSPGHVSFWRERDRVLVLGDVLFGHHPLTSRPGPHEPPAMFTLDADRNRASARKVAALRPSLVCFGHGPPLRDGGVLTEFVARLPRTAASSGESNDFGDRTALRPGTRDATPDL